MPVKVKDDPNRVNKILYNFEQRIERLEKQVSILSKKPISAADEMPESKEESKQKYESPTSRKMGWVFVWVFLILFLGKYIGLGSLFYFLPLPRYLMTPFIFILLIIGIILILKNPKIPVSGKKTEQKTAKAEKAADEYYKRSAKVSAKTEPRKLSKDKSDLEANIGKKWLPKIGIISIVLGVAFFIVYAIQNKWIGPTGQIAIGVAVGIALIITGEIFERKRYHNYAMTLVGGGFAVIYFAMFAAYRFYHLLPLVADIIAISIIIIVAVYFSIRYDSMIIAAEAFFLGYIVPLLTSSVNTYFLIYAIALTLGLTVLSYYKNWKLLGLGGIVAMYITHIFWLENYNGANESILHLVFLLIYFTMFAAMALKFRQDAKKEIDSLANSKNLIAAIFIVTYLFLFKIDFKKSFMVVIPLIALLLIVFFFVIRFRWNYFAIGGMLMTYFVHWRWLDINFNEFSLSINFIALTTYFLLFTVLLFLLSQDKDKKVNVIGILVNSLSFYALILWPLYRFHKGLEGLFTALLSVFFLVLAFVAYKKKIAHYFSTFLILCFGFLTLAIPLQFNREWITISWAVLTLILVILCFRLEEKVIGIASVVVGLITLSRVLFYDSWKLEAINLANFSQSTRLFAFLTVIIVFYIISYINNKNKNMIDDDYKKYIMTTAAAYAIAATVLTTLIIALEIWDTNLALNSKKLWTSLAFIMQAIIILGFGFSAKVKLFRVMGLMLFGLSIIKVFLYDLSNLETGYRIISFIVLGVIALVGAFLYNKYKEYI